jgi:hypothetical protein
VATTLEAHPISPNLTVPGLLRRVCTLIGSSKIFVGVDRWGCRSVEQDQLAQETVARATVQLPLDQFDLAVGVFRAAVVVGRVSAASTAARSRSRPFAMELRKGGPALRVRVSQAVSCSAFS